MTSKQPAGPVVVAVDGSPDGTRALQYGVEEAHRHGTGLRIVHVQPQTLVMSPMLPLVPGDSLHDIAAHILKQAEQQARDFGWTGPDLDPVLANGGRYLELVEHARDATCLVVGRRSSTVRHLLTGSTSSALAGEAPVPVICVPETWNPDSGMGGRVVVGVERPEHLHPLLAVAFEEARCRLGRVHLLHAWRPRLQYDAVIGDRVLKQDWVHQTQELLTGLVHDDQPGSDVEWTVEARYTDPAHALHEAGETSDLLVLGRHGYDSGIHRELGSTVRALLRTSTCPVLVVPM